MPVRRSPGCEQTCPPTFWPHPPGQLGQLSSNQLGEPKNEAATEDAAEEEDGQWEWLKACASSEARHLEILQITLLNEAIAKAEREDHEARHRRTRYQRIQRKKEWKQSRLLKNRAAAATDEVDMQHAQTLILERKKE